MSLLLNNSHDPLSNFRPMYLWPIIRGLVDFIEVSKLHDATCHFTLLGFAIAEIGGNFLVKAAQ